MMADLCPVPCASADDAERVVAGGRFGREFYSCEPLGRGGTTGRPRTITFTDLGSDPTTGAAIDTPRAPVRFRPRTKRNRSKAGA